MDFLANQTSARNMYKALTRLPDKLYATFDDALCRIESQPDEHFQLGYRAISWIFHAKRSLTIGELREALSVEDGDTRLDRSGHQDIDLILDVCCGMVSIDEQDNVVRLVHYSFQQYLEDKWKKVYPNSQRRVAKICITYLMLEDFSPKGIDEAKELRTDFQDGTSQPISHAQ